MSHHTLTAEAKAAIKANLELELNARKEKLVAMCEAQVASLRSRLERRINRIPSSKRNMKLIDLLDASIPATAKLPAKKEIALGTTTAPIRAPAATTAVARKTRAVPAKPAPKPVPKIARGKKRPSDDGDKENEELNVPKKRAKPTTAPGKPAATTRSTRAASRKAAPQVLSPKPNNSRSAPRTRRQR